MCTARWPAALGMLGRVLQDAALIIASRLSDSVWNDIDVTPSPEVGACWMIATGDSLEQGKALVR